MSKSRGEFIKVDDATHAYRGYRKQILFVIHEILCTRNKSLTFCPEGIEDFSIENESTVLSIFQVKDLSEHLVFSDLTSGTQTSFLQRACSYRKQYPETEIVFAHYNQLGPELQKLKQKNSDAISTIVDKTCRSIKCTKEEAESLIKKLKFRHLKEQDISTEINSILKDSLFGIDPDKALDNLSWWIFTASENQVKITRTTLIDKIQSIGEFIRDRSLESKWLGSIIPFKDLVSTKNDKDRLSISYKEGIAASMPHILAGLDIIRASKLLEIEQSFLKSNIVIIHGASGQGKTTLALRYFHEYIPVDVSYQIKEASDLEQAFLIGEAILKHHRAFGIPMFLYYDVSPNDNNWVHVLERLSNEQDILVLATIREEDWRRSPAPKEKFKYVDFELSLETAEAELIFNNIQQQVFTSFEESWEKFGTKGALLEYVYFLNFGESLYERLKSQINRIQNEVNQGKLEPELLEVLRIIALITGFESRAVSSKIEALMKLPAPTTVIEKLNKEYLIKVSKNGALLEGFHPIRSKIICELLFDEVFSPWIKTLPSAFLAIYEEDLEVFLLHCFSRRKSEERAEIIKLLTNYSPHFWHTYSGIISSLLWIGVDNYVSQNKHLVEELRQNYPDIDFSIALDIDMAGAAPNLSKNIIELFQKQNPERAKIIQSIQNRQSKKDGILQYLNRWLVIKKKSPSLPRIKQDYLGLSNFIYWSASLGINHRLSRDLLKHIEKNIEKLDIQTIAELVNACHQGEGSPIRIIFDNFKEDIKAKLLKSTGILYLEESEIFVKANYVIPLNEDDFQFSTSDKENNNAKSMHIVGLLYRLFPNKQNYSTQGYGHKSILPEVGLTDKQLPDDTFKNIPVDNLPPYRLVRLNGIFIGRMQYHFRLKTWKDYTERITYLRKNQIEVFSRLSQGLKKYYKSKDFLSIINSQLYQLLVNHLEELKNVPKLPQISVDEWGIVREDMDKDNPVNKLLSENDSLGLISLSLQKYKKYNKLCRDLFSYSTFFLNHLCEVISSRINQKEINTLSGNNLTDILKFLPEFQDEFRKCFVQLVENDSLIQIEKEEEKAYTQLFGIWTAFLLYPEKKLKDAVNNRELFVRKLFKNRIMQSFNNTLNSTPFIKFNLSEGKWNDKNSLWVKAELKNPVDLTLNEPELFNRVVTGLYISECFKETISGLNENELVYFLQFHWNDICLIITYNQKVIFRTIFQKYILSVISENETQYFCHAVEDSFLQNQLNLEVWHSEQIDLAFAILKNFKQLKVIIGHLLEILTPLDEKNIEVEEEVLKPYFVNQIETISKTLQEYLDSCLKLKEICNERYSEESDEDSLLIGGFNLLVDNYKQLFPDPDQELDGEFKMHMDFDVLKNWKDRLDIQEENFSQIYFMLLFDGLLKESPLPSGTTV